MKFCFLAPTVYRYYQGNGFGGAELQVVRWSGELVKAGHEVHIITNDYGQPEKTIFDGVIIWNKALRFLGGSNIYFLKNNLLVAKFIAEKIKPDFCIVKTPKTVLFTAILAKCFYHKLQVINFFASNMDFAPSRNITNIPYKIAVKFDDGAIFQTEYQRNHAEQYRNKSNIVLRNLFVPQSAVIDNCEKKYDFLWIGQYSYYKNPEIFYELAKRLSQYKFAFISKDSPKEYEKLQTQIKALSNVTYLGRIPFEQTQSLFAQSRCYLNTSCIEGFPNTFLQAWYSHLPILSLSVDPDGVVISNNAGLVSGNNFDNLVNNANLLMQDRQLCEKCGNNGFEYLCKNHFAESLVPKMEQFLQALLSK